MSSEPLRAQVAALPAKPGVYTFRDQAGKVIYVGKAANLRSRVRSYFGSPRSLEGKTRKLAARIAALEIVTTRTEQDAHAPRSNAGQAPPAAVQRAAQRDDKHYPYLKVDVKSPWPRVTITRRVQNDGARYFGPYASAKSVRTSLDLVKKTLPLALLRQGNHRLRPAPLPRVLHPPLHRALHLLLHARRIPRGDRPDDALPRRQELGGGRAADGGNAGGGRGAELRAGGDAAGPDIAAVERVTEQQITADAAESEIDAFGMAVDGDEAVVQVLFIRGQKMTGSDHFSLAGVREEPLERVLGSFLRQYYEGAVQAPRLVLIPNEIEQPELLGGWLTQKRGGAVEIRRPQRGEKRRLTEMAAENAREALEMQRVRWLADRGRTDAALDELEQALSLPAPPHRIECYDISHNQGDSTVASMVVFLDGRPATREYRRFRIKSIEGPDDFASMAEVMRRRFRRLGEQRQAERAEGYELPAELNQADAEEQPDGEGQPNGETERSGDEGWGAIPDLVIVDGGRGQVSAAHDVMRNLAVDDIPLAGLAKREELLFVVDTAEPIRLDRRSQGMYLVQRIRDEAHRFAISYHRRLRAQRASRSPLDRIAGIGPTRKKALLRKFGSLQAIRAASAEEIAATPGLTRRVAEQLKAEL